MKRYIAILITMITIVAFAAPVSAAQSFPSFTILEVVKDQTVTIQTSNFPANDTFQVTMGLIGTKGIGGVIVGSTNSGSGGSFKATYNIPSSLAGSAQIAIRLESPTSGFFAYNWFSNNTGSATGTQPPATATSTPAPTTTPVSGYSGFPTFSIVSVAEDMSVTILTKNLPSNDTFSVTMGKMGTQGVGGEVVASTNSGSGGALNFTYNIPASLQGLSQISIRMQSPTTGYFAYNWFWNSSGSSSATPVSQPTSTPVPPSSGYSGFPTFSVTTVVKDKSVTIQGSNFPANDTFNVLMGPIGTKGVGGALAGTQNSGSGGSLTATYTIPPSMVGATQIAIRLESPTSGYFAYNWFDNSTTP